MSQLMVVRPILYLDTVKWYLSKRLRVTSQLKQLNSNKCLKTSPNFMLNDSKSKEPLLQVRLFSSIHNEDINKTSSSPNEDEQYDEIQNKLVPRIRLSNPDGLDGDKYVKRICEILHGLEPTKYAFFAGLGTTQSQAGETQPKSLKPGKRQPFVKPIKFSIHGSNVPSEDIQMSVQTNYNEITVVDNNISVGDFHLDTTADFVKRSISSSSELEVKSNCKEMIELINAIALTNVEETSSTVDAGDKFSNAQSVTALESRCIELFHAWVGRSKLGLGYLFYLTNQQNRWSDEFIIRIVHHLAPRVNELPTEEIVTLMLMIFFRRDVWNADAIYEVLDPTLLQKKLTNIIDSTKSVTDAELCAICLGLRKISGFTANLDEFRDSLYRRLKKIGNILSSERAFSLSLEHISALNMAIIQITVLLQQGYHLGSRDPAKHILHMLQCYEEAVIAYDENDGEDQGSLGGRFLMETRAAVKIMMFGSSKGGLHNKEVTARVVERLVLGKHIRHLSLRDMVSFLKFLGQVKEFGTLRMAADYSVKDIAMVVSDEIRELTKETDQDQYCGPEEVLLILQSWLYLSLFDKFDLTNIKRVMDAVNELPQQLFESKSSINTDEQNIALGRSLAEACHRVLFPRSYKVYLSMDLSSNGSLSPKDSAQVSRLISSLDRTLKIYLKPDVTNDIKLEDIRIQRLITLNQSKVPALVYEKTNLPAIHTLSRRQVLLHAVHKGLLTALESEGYLKIVHILPHFQEPDIVFGHIGGNKISVPLNLSEAPTYDIKNAPDFGEWTVISIDAPSTTARELGELASTMEFSPQHASPERHRQLMRLGYQIYSLTANDQKQLLRGNPTKWAHRILANILTGNPQGDPNPKEFDRTRSAY